VLSPKQARLVVVAIRGAFGITAMIKPHLMFPALRLHARDNADGSYVMRIFGSRESFLAIAELGAFGKNSLPNVMRGSAGVDAADSVSYVLAYRDGRVGKLSTGLFALVGVVAVALNLYAATEQETIPLNKMR
jgi:hypothetical protein